MNERYLKEAAAMLQDGRPEEDVEVAIFSTVIDWSDLEVCSCGEPKVSHYF